MNTSLQEFINQYIIQEEMLWKGAAKDQVFFVRDDLASLVGVGLDYEGRKRIATVISTHRSKLIELPVYKLSRPDIGVYFVLRDNFYNWKLSVVSESPIEVDLTDLCHTSYPIDPSYTGNELAPCYFEGFPPEEIFGYYGLSDKKRFSAQIYGGHRLWVAIWLIMKSLNQIKPYVWHTQKTHLAELTRGQ